MTADDKYLKDLSTIAAFVVLFVWRVLLAMQIQGRLVLERLIAVAALERMATRMQEEVVDLPEIDYNNFLKFFHVNRSWDIVKSAQMA